VRRYAETTRRTFVPLLDVWCRDMIAAAEDADAVVIHGYAVVAAPAAHRFDPPVGAELAARSVWSLGMEVHQRTRETLP